MRKTAALLIATVIMASAYVGLAQAEPLHRACRDRTPKGYIFCFGHRFGSNVRIGVCIARHESGLQPGADNGTHAGLFQWSKFYWPATRASMPIVDRATSNYIKNARTNAAFAMRRQSYRNPYQPWAGNECVS